MGPFDNPFNSLGNGRPSIDFFFVKIPLIYSQFSWIYIFRMSGRRKAQILEVRKTSSAKPLPAILSRKRKNDEDPMQPDLHSYFSAVNHKTEHNENLKGVSFANIQISRPSASRYVIVTIDKFIRFSILNIWRCDAIKQTNIFMDVLFSVVFPWPPSV